MAIEKFPGTMPEAPREKEGEQEALRAQFKSRGLTPEHLARIGESKREAAELPQSIKERMAPARGESILPKPTAPQERGQRSSFFGRISSLLGFGRRKTESTPVQPRVIKAGPVTVLPPPEKVIEPKTETNPMRGSPGYAAAAQFNTEFASIMHKRVDGEVRSVPQAQEMIMTLLEKRYEGVDPQEFAKVQNKIILAAAKDTKTRPDIRQFLLTTLKDRKFLSYDVSDDKATYHLTKE